MNYPTPFPFFLQPPHRAQTFCRQPVLWLGTTQVGNSLSGLCDLFYPFLCWVLLQEPKSSCFEKTAETVWTFGNFF